MARVKMMCPISKEACTECPIYRGRHFYLCFSKEYHGVSFGAEQIDELKALYTLQDNTGQEKNLGCSMICNTAPRGYIMLKS
jgi:hypothetical protein